MRKNKPVANCINLDRQPEKYEEVKKEMGDVFDIKRISAIDGKLQNISGIKAIYDTNIELFKNSLNSDEPYLIIIEDDIYKSDNFHYYWSKILDFINKEENKDSWDFISLDFFLLNLDSPKIEVYNDFLYKVSKSRSAGCTIYNKNFIKKNINYLKSFDKCSELLMHCLDMTMKHDERFIKLIPKDLILKQIVNKFSETAGFVTSNYEDLYKETIEYIKNYSFENSNNIN